MRILSASFVLLLLALTSACATAPEKASTGPLRARDYYPLAVGNRWQYRITPGGQQPDQEVTILDRDQQGFFVDNKGGKLAPRTDGIFDGTQNRYMLQEPITEGHEWMAVPEPTVVEHYRVAAVGVTTRVPAGNFEGCVDVESKVEVKNPQTGAPGMLTVTWTYAPGVGLVRFSQSFKPGDDPAQVVGKMELISFDVKPTE